MSTKKETTEYILGELKNNPSFSGGREVFSVRAMFGEYALYAECAVVGLICNDQLYVKDVPESQELADYCDMDSPYPNAKEHYVIEEQHYDEIENLSQILKNIARSRKLKVKSKVAKKMVAGSFSDRVVKIALSITSGSVSTYGALARAAGGGAMSSQSVTGILGKAYRAGQTDIPFHRIVYSDGRVWTSPEYDKKRRALYKKEGIEIDERGRIKNFEEKLIEFK